MIGSEASSAFNTNFQTGVHGAHVEERGKMASNGVLGFQSNLAHLQDEMGLLNLRLSREVHRMRQQNAGPYAGSNAASVDGEFRGLLARLLAAQDVV